MQNVHGPHATVASEILFDDFLKRTIRFGAILSADLRDCVYSSRL